MRNRRCEKGPDECTDGTTSAKYYDTDFLKRKIFDSLVDLARTDHVFVM